MQYNTCLKIAKIFQCLCVHGTITFTKYTTIVMECKKRDIEVISFGADGDSRLITSMCVISKLHDYTSKKCDYVSLESGSSLVVSEPTTWKSWFFIEAEEAVCSSRYSASGYKAESTIAYFIAIKFYLWVNMQH